MEFLKNNPQYPIHLEALIAWHKWNFETSREEYKRNGIKVWNPYFWEYGEFVEYVGVSNSGLICYREIQSGTEPGDELHIIEISSWYDNYKPFHDRWELQLERERKLNSLL